MTNIELLKGSKFRRNKYGLSIWEDTITEVACRYELVIPVNRLQTLLAGKKYIEVYNENKKFGFIPKFQVKGSNGHWYNINEIIVYL